MCPVTPFNYSPLYEAYADDANKVAEAIEIAVEISASKLGAGAARLFSLADKLENDRERLAA